MNIGERTRQLFETLSGLTADEDDQCTLTVYDDASLRAYIDDLASPGRGLTVSHSLMDDDGQPSVYLSRSVHRPYEDGRSGCLLLSLPRVCERARPTVHPTEHCVYKTKERT